MHVGAVDIPMFHHNAKPLKHPQLDHEAKAVPIHLEYLKNPTKLHRWVEVLTPAQSLWGAVDHREEYSGQCDIIPTLISLLSTVN